MLRYVTICVCWLALVACGGRLCAQDAELSGLVKDPSDAVIPGATLRLLNQSTGTSRVTETNESGMYTLPALSPGTYDLEVSKEGFQSVSRTGIKLSVAARMRINFTLPVGSTSDKVTVTAVNERVQSTETSVGGLITTSELTRLPVNGRNYTRLILLMPGTSDRSKSQSNGTFSGTNLYSVNGQRAQDNNYSLDGVENNLFRMNSPGASPPMDALQEFRVMTGSSAEFGRSTGANVNMVIKSGTRNLHGSLYEFLRNDLLDANGFFANRVGQGKVAYRQNQYGVSAGGPVEIPGIYKGRERTFWFASWEGFRSRQASTLISTVPVAEQRNGDFSQQTRQIFDPLTSEATQSGTAVRQPFAGNQIPASRISAASRYILNTLIPLPNRTGLTSNYVNTQPQANDRDAFVMRFDHTVGTNNYLSVRYLHQKAGQQSPQSNSNYSTEARFDVQNVAASWTRVISANSVLEVKFGYNQPFVPSITRDPSLTRAEFFKNTGIRMFEQETPYDTTPNVSVTGQFSTPASSVATDDHTYQQMATYARQAGRHALKAGVSYSRRQYFYVGSTPRHGTATFDTRLTQLATLSTSGHATASFLLGYPSQIDRGQGDNSVNGRQNAFAYFLQDDWRVTSRLTINIGLRHEVNNPPYDTTDQVGTLLVKRDAQTGRYSGVLLWATTNPVTGEAARRESYGRSLQANDYRNLGPRAGIAFQLSSKTTIRTGAGIFYNSTFMQELQDKRKFYPYSISQSFVTNTGVLPDLSLTDLGPPYTNTTEIGGWAQRPENRTPYSMQWNFFVAQQLPLDSVLEIGYVGSGNRRQIGYAPFNVAVTPGPGAVQARRLLPDFGDLSWGANLYNSNYNALQVKAERRFLRGMQFQVNYTWSRSMDGQSSLAEGKAQDPFNQRADYSRSSWDIRHVFQFAYVWELPFGRSRRFGANWPKAMDLALGGWGLEGITRYQTGGPVNVLIGQDRANIGSTSQRPDVIRNPNTGPRTVERWFDTSAFQMPALYTYGNAGAFIVDSDGRHNWDLSIAKHFSLFEGHRLETRAEMFNASNSVAMGDPNATFTSSSFGQVTSATSSRQIQLSLRYTF